MKIRFARYRFSLNDLRLTQRRGHAEKPPETPFDPIDPGPTQGWEHILQNNRLLAVKTEMYFGVENFEHSPLEPDHKYADILPGQDYLIEFDSGESAEIRQAIPIEIGTE